MGWGSEVVVGWGGGGVSRSFKKDSAPKDLSLTLVLVVYETCNRNENMTS